MDWSKFNNHGESDNHAFEVMCNLLFKNWCYKNYDVKLKRFVFVNGAGGDGGVEAFGTLEDGEIVAVQSKWFRNSIGDAQIKQIKDSFHTAINVRPSINKYIVCIPRDLGSQKVGKGNKVTQNTEEGRWKTFVENEAADYPGVEIILWDETRLQELLALPDTQGIYRFWFDNTVVFDEQFEVSYQKAICSWAKLKYVPEVYSAGYINDRMSFFLGSPELTERRVKELDLFIGRLENIRRAFQDILDLGVPEKENELKDKIVADLPVIKDWIEQLLYNRLYVLNGEKVDFLANKFSLNCKAQDVKGSSLHFGHYFHFNEAEKLLENIEDDFFDLQRLLAETDDNRLIFLGNQGTGKTAGIVFEANQLLEQHTHLPILVHAKDFTEGETWGTIIEKTLGLSMNWDENELLVALQNAATLRYDCNNNGIVPKLVICVDGIDEANSWDFWKEKINEAEVFRTLMPQLRFVFLSRPYVFKDRFALPYADCFCSLPINGDTEVEQICDKYFKTYKVDIGDNLWIKPLLRTPIAVRMFCDIYKNQSLCQLEKNTLVITNLYKEKIRLLEEEFKRENSNRAPSGIIKMALVEIAVLFTENHSFSYDEINDRVSNQIRIFLQAIIDFLIQEGFIYSYQSAVDDFSVPQILYSWGNQPALDYLLGQKIFEVLNSGEEVKVSYSNGIYQMLALIAIENGILLPEFSNIELDESTAFDVMCYALANCSMNAAGFYREYVKTLMHYSVAEFREIVNRIIIPVAAIEDHPLGMRLLDEFLREFKSSAERDIWWSVPAYLRDSYNADWRAYTEIDFESINLTEDSCRFGQPLLLVWSCASVNNEVRQHSRYELTKWGIKNPLDFWELFKFSVNINDEQISEDIFSVAYGIALSQFVDETYLIEAANWFLKNVFSKTGLSKFENIALRYYGAGIVKIAIARALIEKSVEKKIKPPYMYQPQMLPLCEEALGADRMCGYEAIDYDLARYVLADRLDFYFRENYKTHEYSESAKIFLDKYAKFYKDSTLKIEGFIIAIAYGYLLKNGWTKDKFWQYENKDKIGVDIAIRRTYYHATHGQMSRIMTVAEKNVWLAKHNIEAVFANEIETSEDYSQLENFVNTYQDFANRENRESNHSWVNMEILAASDTLMMREDNILKWMTDPSLPDFERWFGTETGKILLGTFTNVQNNISGIEEAVWVSSGAVLAADFDVFLQELDKYSEGRIELLNVSDFSAGQDCRCYCTPQEACLVHSGREINNSILIPSPEKEIEVFKFVLECLSADELETEKRFSLPTAFVRNITHIVYGDGYKYCDTEGTIIASYSCAGENWGTQQNTLFIEENVLNEALEQCDYKMFWLYRVYREPSSKAKERFPGLMHNTDKTFIVWKTNGKLSFKELSPIERPINPETMIESNSFLKDLLESYGLTEADIQE